MSNGELPLVQVEGEPYEMGYQYGRACADMIAEFARKIVPEEARRNGVDLSPPVSDDVWVPYARYSLAYLPHLADEIRGIAAGAKLSEADVWIANLHREVLFPITINPEANECTAFAVTPERSAEGETIIAKTCDKFVAMEDYGLILHMRPAKGPAMLMYVLAGNVGAEGINSAGLAYFGNALTCSGWRHGVPSTFLMRATLEEETVDGAIAALRRAHRAKSSNFMFAHADGTIRNVETTVDADGVLEPEDGVLVHSNHYIHPDLLSAERSVTGLANSRVRLARIQQRLRELERVSVRDAQALLADHSDGIDSVCAHTKERNGTLLKTICSMVAVPARRTMWARRGNACEGEFTVYTL